MKQRSDKISMVKAYLNLTIVVILIGAIVFTTGFGICLYMARGQVSTLTNQGLTRDVEYLHNYIDNQLQRVEDAAYSITWSDNHDCAVVDVAEMGGEDDMFQLLESFINMHPYICGIAIGLEPTVYSEPQGEYGFAVYVTNVSGRNERLRLGEINDYRNKEWYVKAASLNAPYWSLPFRETNMGKVVTCFSLPLHDIRGNLIGVLALDIDTEAFRQKCNEIMPFEHTTVVLIDRENRFISHPDTTLILRHTSECKGGNLNELSQEHAEDNDVAKNIITLGDDDNIVIYDMIERTGWVVGIVCLKNEVYGGVNHMRTITTVIALVSILLMIVCFLYLFRKMQKIAQSKASMENELKIAADIQMGMIPKTYPAFPDCKELDVYGFLKPAKTVGGDLYDYFIRGGKLFFCIGDVSGKGVPASLFMSVVRALFRNVSANIDSSADIVSSLNSALSQGNEQCMFCTLFIGIIDLNTGKFEYCNAGHDAPIIVPGESSDAYFLKVHPNLAVGMIEDFQFVADSTELKPGDSIFMYTDGVTEAENSSKELFGLPATLQLVADVFDGKYDETINPDDKDNKHMARNLVNRIYKILQNHTLGAEQNDDITMVMVRFLQQN